jgi:hypothetical protein
MVACHEHCLSMWDAHPREHLMRGAIRGPQAGVKGGQSVVIRGHQRSSLSSSSARWRGSSEAIRAHQRTLARLVAPREAFAYEYSGRH